jgi:GDP-D-mannose 3',5'-epimerase
MVTIDELVDIVEEIAGLRLERLYDVDAPKGVRGRSSDNTAIKRELSWEPSVPLREGLEKTYAWIYDQMVARVPARA